MIRIVRELGRSRTAGRICLAAFLGVCAPVALAQNQPANPSGDGPKQGQNQPVATQQQTNEKIQQLAGLVHERPAEVPIGSGDLLHVDVFDVPELSRDVRVSDTGEISYPLIPEKIVVAGLTPFELEAKMEKTLIENGLVSHPQVSVFVKEQFSAPVSVVGAVNHTMVYQVTRPTTLIEVLAAAGGVSDSAGPEVIISRPRATGAAHAENTSAKVVAVDNPPADEQKITIRLQDLLESGDIVYNVPVIGGDTVTVPPAGIVYILGFGIAQPGGYVLQGHGEQVTVLKAVAIARGLTGFAKANSSMIMRTNPATGKRDAIPVHLKDIEKHHADDVALVNNDILYIPDSLGKKALAKGTESAVGIATGVAVYRAY